MAAATCSSPPTASPHQALLLGPGVGVVVASGFAVSSSGGGAFFALLFVTGMDWQVAIRELILPWKGRAVTDYDNYN